MASTEPADTTSAAAPAEAPAPAPAADGEKKEERKPLTPEEKEKRKAERAEKRKELRKAARQAAKEARERGEAPKPKPKKEKKGEKATGEVTAPEGAAPKITVGKLPANIATGDLKSLFAKYGTVLRAEVSKRKDRPSIGTIYYTTHGEVKKAVQALNGKYKFPGESEAITIQYGKDALEWGKFIKETTDGVADTLREYKYKPGVLRSKSAKDLITRIIFLRKKTPAKELITAALLVSLNEATPQELVSAKLINSAGAVQQLLQEDKANAPAETKASAKGKKDEGRGSSRASKLDKTFDAVVPLLDKLEKDRWNRMAKANLRLNERHRFRFVDILATPSLELWRWMVEDCEMTPAEAGTCFAILQNHYGFTK